ncbi:YlmC/YmxH family sporulation protein [Desulforamulus hydrothermalis]|uniref:YlmC/YmxH family sporulation protein n=1 Tax=Desulforamulus hydrothermalis TaxID=412895 RepID=UPI000302FD9C|nr:YlmC/YmxH family sporulation protein [Desulforamulus hydrothermalis]SHH08718.1 sporulation protein, YlmC/YmxH family [Desulforamulus hydrothermalis Lam5 = DSM 18033]
MRLGELIGKEIVNIHNGARLGIIGESDVTIDIESGAICSIILPKKTNLINMWTDKPQMVIPWESIRKIGEEIIIVELNYGNQFFSRYKY